MILQNKHEAHGKTPTEKHRLCFERTPTNSLLSHMTPLLAQRFNWAYTRPKPFGMEAPRLGIKFYVLHLLILHGKLIRIAPLPTLEHLYETAYSVPLKPDILTTRTDFKMKRSTGRWERGPSESSRNRTDARQKRCSPFPALFPLPFKPPLAACTNS